MSLALQSCPALVLNADFRPLSYYPLSLWSWQEAIKAVVAGGQYISPAITQLTGMSSLLGAPESPFDLLSSRERDVLRRVVAGYTSADIGRQLSLSPKTIETYRGRLMVKLGVNDRAALIRLTMNFEVPIV